MYLHQWSWGYFLEDHLCCHKWSGRTIFVSHKWSAWVGPFYVLPGPFMSMHKWSGRTRYDGINAWSPRTIYAVINGPPDRYARTIYVVTGVRMRRVEA